MEIKKTKNKEEHYKNIIDSQQRKIYKYYKRTELLKFLFSIVIVIIVTLSLTIIVKENQHEKILLNLKEAELQKEENRLVTLTEFTENYNDLYASYNELYAKYEELAAENGFYQGWELYRVSSYTSLDPGCNDIAATGINIKQLSRLYNFCAVDPTIIPYGSVVLVKFDTGIEAFLAADCGGLVKGKHIDLYFVNDLKNAFNHGNREIEVKVFK